MAPSKKRRKHFLVALAGGVLIAVIGAFAACVPLGDGLARLSYDLPFFPFLFRSQAPDELVMVYLDEKVKANLGEPMDQPLNRRSHVQLINKLKEQHPKLVLYDILMGAPGSDPAIDDALAKAIRENGSVVLVANFGKQLQENAAEEAPIPPLTILREAAAGWGLAKFSPDPD